MANLWNAFSAIVRSTPDAPAVIMSETTASFGDLNAMAEQFAGRLAARGVTKGDVVALQLPKRVATYALVLACLRLGAPYVFIDPKNPRERTDRILATIQPKLFFGIAEAPNPYGEVLHFGPQGEIDWGPVGHAPLPIHEVTGSDPAYIMFTSGSTGEPKGAVIPHQGVLSLMEWAKAVVHRREAERFTAINPLHFDNSVFDIYCGLLNGAALVPVETFELSNPVSWVKAIRRGQATVMFAVPTLFLILDQLGLLTPQSLPSVHTFQFGGEGFPIGKLREFHARFADAARLINVYGPTETSCICTSLEIGPETLGGADDAFPPLGRMHENFAHRLLDENDKPVAAGDAGELWIGGPCVGLGYYANPTETRRRFIQDPGQDRYRSIWYRTGDLVAEDRNGQLQFRGRVDNQIKIRGHRIELEEIDLAVESIPGVSRALAVRVAHPEGDEIGVMFAASRVVAKDEVFSRCREKLPDYMRPAVVEQIEKLPVNANGKADRRAVAAIFAGNGGAR